MVLSLFLGFFLVLTVFLPGLVLADGFSKEFSGHFKGQGLYNTYPDTSLFRQFAGANTKDISGELRLKFARDFKANWDFNADYQLMGLYGDSLKAFRDVVALPASSQRVINDDARLFDLTDILTAQDKHVALQRLDRLQFSYIGEKLVVRVGRQAVSWGNGLIYSPMDIFNPFDPSAIDKEYKTGDDMLYGQYLREQGDDLQAVMVFRRNPDNDRLETGQSSLAIKYHGFAGQAGYDLLIARHFGDSIVGIGGDYPLGGAVWRGDIVLTVTDQQSGSEKFVASAVSSLSYAWMVWQKNISGVLEYFYNGFGEHGHHTSSDLAANAKLVERINRGELFTLGRHYLSASTTIELAPLLVLTPNVFYSLSDSSALLQGVVQYDVKQNMQLLAALNFPVGDDGSEFGGIDSGLKGIYLSQGPGLFLQAAWYF